MIVLRPNGLIERVDNERRPVRQWPAYGRTKQGATTAGAIVETARRDRRRRGRAQGDPLRGRLVDVMT